MRGGFKDPTATVRASSEAGGGEGRDSLLRAWNRGGEEGGMGDSKSMHEKELVVALWVALLGEG